MRVYSAWLLKCKFISVPPPPPLGCKIKHSRMKECSETMLLQNKFCWDILLHVNEKSKNKVEKDKKNLSIFNEVLQIIFHNPPPRSLNLWEYVIAIEHQCKPEKQIFENGRKHPTMALLVRVGNLLVDFMPLNSIKILELPPLN